MRLLLYPVLAIGLFVSGCVSTAATEARKVADASDGYDLMVEALVRLLDGEFDSAAQKREDDANQVPQEQAHGWVNRRFVTTRAPAVGVPVLIGTTAYNAPWVMDSNEFLVWTFSKDDDGGVLMSPARFKDWERLMPFSRDGGKLSGFTAEDLEPAISGASCKIVWTVADYGYLGRTKPCFVMSTTQNKMLNWVWEYKLTSDALWISFSGIDENGVVLDGTPEGRPYRLDRVRYAADDS